MNNQIDKMIAATNGTVLKKAQKLLDSGDVLNVQFSADEDGCMFDALISHQGGILMPYLLMGDEDALVCQCEKEEKMCVHKAALLLAAQVMREMDCPDYREAMKWKVARTLESTLGKAIQ